MLYEEMVILIFLRNHFLMSLLLIPLSLQFEQVLQVSLLWNSDRLAPSIYPVRYYEVQTLATLSYSELNAANAVYLYQSFTDPPSHPQHLKYHRLDRFWCWVFVVMLVCTHFLLQLLNHVATQTSRLLLHPAAPSPSAAPASNSSP